MKLQKGRFIVKTIDELKDILIKDNNKKIIDLGYIRQIQYDENSISESSMSIEYYKNDYTFYPIPVFNKNNQQMYIYANKNTIDNKLKENPNFLSRLAKYNISLNTTLQDYINNPNDCFYDFWWNTEINYFIFFGEEKKQIVEAFINESLSYDGSKEEIKRKLLTIGYKL